MTDTTTPLTAQQLNEMQAELDSKKAELSISKIAEAFDLLEAHETQEFATSLSEIANAMPDNYARNQLQNVVSILASTTMVLNSERERNQRILDGSNATMPMMPSPIMPPITPPAE